MAQFKNETQKKRRKTFKESRNQTFPIFSILENFFLEGFGSILIFHVLMQIGTKLRMLYTETKFKIHVYELN